MVIKNSVSEFKVSTSFCNIQDFFHGNVVPLTLSRASCFSLMTCQLTNAVCIFQSKGKDFPIQQLSVSLGLNYLMNVKSKLILTRSLFIFVIMFYTCFR